jgi:cation/acetate symporter
MLGGMRAVTWTQVAQYIVLIVAYLVPVVILSAQRYGCRCRSSPTARCCRRSRPRAGDGAAGPRHGGADQAAHDAFLSYSPLNYFGLILCLMLGTASLPHVLMRYFTTPSVREARVSVAWSLVFIFILYFTAPAYAAFAKLEVFREVIGQTLTACRPGSTPTARWAS